LPHMWEEISREASGYTGLLQVRSEADQCG